MPAGFREAYQHLKETLAHDCRKHSLHPNPEAWAASKIEQMSILELLDALEIHAQIVDDEASELHEAILDEIERSERW